MKEHTKDALQEHMQFKHPLIPVNYSFRKEIQLYLLDN